MMLRITLIYVLLCMFGLSMAYAQKAVQQQSVPQQVAPQQVQESAAIEPGQRIADAELILRRYGKKIGGGFAFARRGSGPDEIKHIAGILDDAHISACIDYQAGSQLVTGIGICVRPPNGAKANEFWLVARKITLHPDGSYSIQFEPPTAR